MSGRMSDSVTIRVVTPKDAAAITAIYAHYVSTGTATFDTEPPSDHIWADKIANMTACNWPMLVATRDDVVLGYAYAAQFRDRPAYAHTCENSIYVRAEMLGQGIGGALMTALMKAAAQAGFREMIAVISDDAASITLHQKYGFRHAGRMEKVGMKFGRLLDTVYMQRGLTSE